MRDAKEEEKAPSLIQSVAFGREIEQAFCMQRNRPKGCGGEPSTPLKDAS